jgi:Family of unknown function (DUF5681)
MVAASQNWTEDANRRSGRASKQPYPHGDVPDLTSSRHFQCRPSAELTTGYDVDFTNQRFAILRPNRVLKFLAQWYPRDRTGMSVERITPKPRGRPFSKGHSGNPRGRPPGARNAATVLAEQLLDGEVEGLIRKIIQKAKHGDVTALRICIDRILPPRRERPVRFEMPELRSVGDASKAIAALMSAVAKGELGASEAGELSKLIENYVRAVEATELEQRLLTLEQRLK